MRANLKILLRTAYLDARGMLLSPLVFFRRWKVPKDKEIKTILLLRHDRIGDMVLSTPLFKALKEKFSGAKIIVLASERNKEVIGNNPYVDEILIFKGLRQFLKDLKNRRIDLAIDLFCTYTMREAFLAFISGAKYRLGFHEAGREVFFNVRGVAILPSTHMMNQLCRLAACLGIYIQEFEPQIFLKEEEIHSSIDFYKAKGAAGSTLKVAIHPGAFYPSQRWPVENFKEVALEIIEKYGAKIFVFGDEKEADILKKIKAGVPSDQIETCSGVSLREFMSLLSQCQLLICNNSGPLHIAAALKIPTVSTSGPTDEALWKPVGENHIVLKKDLPCIPCQKSVCEGQECLKLITVLDVMAAVDKQVKRFQEAGKDGSVRQKLRILYITGFGTFKGGGQRSLYLLVKYLNKDIFEPYVVVPEHGELETAIAGLGVKVFALTFSRIRNFRIPSMIREAMELKKIVETHHIDLIHTDSDRESFYAGLVAKWCRIPLVIHLRVTDAPFWIDTILYGLADKMIAVSKAAADRFKGRDIQKKVHIVYNGAELGSLIAAERDSNSDILKIGYFGRIEPRKGIDVFIRAVQTVNSPEVAAFIIGDGDPGYVNELRKLCSDTPNVFFEKFQLDVTQKMASMDIIILPSRKGEGLSRSLIEAMTMGKLVIVSDSPSNPELLGEELKEFIFKTGDEKALAKLLKYILNNKQELEKISRIVRARAQKYFDIEKNTRSIEEIYNLCLHNGHGKRHP